MGIRAGWKKSASLCAIAAVLFAPPGRCDTKETGLFDFRRRAGTAQTQRLMPGGAAAGVSVASLGVAVIGVNRLDGRESPAQRAGLQTGDIIRQMDGKEVESARQLMDAIGQGRKMALKIYRGDRELAVELTPEKCADGMFRMGAWVRDGAAGIGTLTYYDPQTGSYGALGHAICDSDTGRIVPIRGGDLVDASIQGIRKSQVGEPGELLGVLGDTCLGSVEKNTECGVFGHMNEKYVNPLYPQGLEIVASGQVREGAATILSTIDTGGMKAYECQIVSVRRQEQEDTRGMLIQITDPALLEKTGGIVQGMSGSPIIQDGKLVGAVTHVLVNDPTRGYGIFIENMLEAAS